MTNDDTLSFFQSHQIKRSAGQNAIAAQPTGRPGEAFYSSYYGEVSDYTKRAA